MAKEYWAYYYNPIPSLFTFNMPEEPVGVSYGIGRKCNCPNSRYKVKYKGPVYHQMKGPRY